MTIEIPNNLTVLGIESSCDETSAALLANGELRSVVISSQFFHTHFGGVVPELASRAHVRAIMPIVREAFRQADIDRTALDAVAVTHTPGLMGSLLVGLSFAKGMALALGLPLLGVHHIEAHIFSILLEAERPELPFLALIVSGGHTQIVLVRGVGDYKLLGQTIDDAAGEAFDKVAKMIGHGYPGGPIIDKLSKLGNPDAFRFPRPMINEDHFDFSFSGLKTSVLYQSRKVDVTDEQTQNNLAASFQRAAVDVLVNKSLRAAKKYAITNIVAVGGVSANSELRSRMQEECARSGCRFFSPRPLFSTDNAAMIAMLGALKVSALKVPSLDVAALNVAEGDVTNAGRTASGLSLRAAPRTALENL